MNNDNSSKLKNITQEEFELEISKIEGEKRFSYVDMSEINFNNKDCSNVIFENVKIGKDIMHCTRIEEASFNNARFYHCDLLGVAFGDCTCIGTIFTETNLKNSSFYFGKMNGTGFLDCSLEHTEISACSVHGLNFRGINKYGILPKSIAKSRDIWCRQVILPESICSINIGSKFFYYDFWNNLVVEAGRKGTSWRKVSFYTLEEFKKEIALDIYKDIIKIFEHHKFAIEAGLCINE